MKTVFNQTLQVLQSMREMQKVAMKNQTRLAWMNVSIKNGFQSNTVNTECEGHVKYCEK
jgi:DNA-binding protein YbaB